MQDKDFDVIEDMDEVSGGRTEKASGGWYYVYDNKSGRLLGKAKGWEAAKGADIRLNRERK